MSNSDSDSGSSENTGMDAGGGGFQPSPAPAYAPQGTTSQKALWSLILAIVSFVVCGIFASIPAIILGSMAKKEIQASGGALTGDGLAKAGVILGWINIVISILAILVFIIMAIVGAGMSQSGY